MKSKLILMLILMVLGAAALGWGQAPADCKPNPLNVHEAKYPCIFPDNRVMYRVGVSAKRLGLSKGRISHGIPLSATGKNIFFDRTPKK